MTLLTLVIVYIAHARIVFNCYGPLLHLNFQFIFIKTKSIIVTKLSLYLSKLFKISQDASNMLLLSNDRVFQDTNYNLFTSSPIMEKIIVIKF